MFSDGDSPNLDSCMSFLAAQEKRNVILNVNLPHWGIFFLGGNFIRRFKYFLDVLGIVGDFLIRAHVVCFI